MDQIETRWGSRNKRFPWKQKSRPLPTLVLEKILGDAKSKYGISKNFLKETNWLNVARLQIVPNGNDLKKETTRPGQFWIWTLGRSSVAHLGYFTTLQTPLLYDPSRVTRFGEISPFLQNLQSLGLFSEYFFPIWDYFGPTLTNFVCHWGSFHWCKRPNVENNLAIWSHWIKARKGTSTMRGDSLFVVVYKKWMA